MRIGIKSFAKKTVIFLMVYMMVVNVVTVTLGLPSSLRYLSDILAVLLLLITIKYGADLSRMKFAKYQKRIIWLLIGWACIGYIVNLYRATLFFWGARNLFRFFIVFFATIMFCEEKEKENCEKIIDVLYLINLVICAYQFLVKGLWADHIEGIFTTGSRGGNAGVILLLSIETVFVFSNYLNKKTSFAKFAFVAGTSMIIAAIGELKVYYLLFILILFSAMVLNRVSVRTIAFTAAAICGLVAGYIVLERIAPESVAVLNLEGIINYAANKRGYTSSNDISRFLVFSQINDWFFKDSLLHKVFGLGLGSCDVSGISFFMSDFYKQYSQIHYSWFSSAMLYLEMGYIGIGLYLTFFVSIIASCFSFRKKDCINKEMYNACIIIVMICIIMVFYNSSMRNDVSFFVFVILGLPFVAYKKCITTDH